MNIIGIGLDATESPRIADDARSAMAIASCTASSPTARSPIVRGAANPVPHLAGRFAAKEAAMKALGTGHSRGVLWKDIEVVRGGGPPQLRLHGGAARRADSMQVRRSPA